MPVGVLLLGPVGTSVALAADSGVLPVPAGPVANAADAPLRGPYTLPFALLLLALVGPNLGQSQPSVRVKISPQHSVRENGEPLAVAVAFKNISDRPIVLLGIYGRDGKGAELRKDLFLGLFRRAKAFGELFHHYNLLAPGEEEAFSVESSGSPGKYRFDFQLDYLVVDDGMLDMPVFEMVKKHPIKRNPPVYASLDEYDEYTQKREVGKLGEVWRERQKSKGLRQVLPYFMEVSPAMLKSTKTVRAAHVLQVQADPDIQQLHIDRPEVRNYRSGIAHFGLVFIKDNLLYVKQEGSYQKLGAVSFEAISHLGSLIAGRQPIQISLGQAPCLQQTFAGRVRKADRPLGQAFVIGQGLPAVDIKPAELDLVWKCMERDHACMSLSQYYDYLVVNNYPSCMRRPSVEKRTQQRVRRHKPARCHGGRSHTNKE
jgi:hypothetical protein